MRHKLFGYEDKDSVKKFSYKPDTSLMPSAFYLEKWRNRTPTETTTVRRT